MEYKGRGINVYNVVPLSAFLISLMSEKTSYIRSPFITVYLDYYILFVIYAPVLSLYYVHVTR